MDKIRIPVAVVTFFAVIYNALPLIAANDSLIVALFAVSPFPVIWMVYHILKDGTPPSKTWDDYFYEDHSYRRNGKEELSNEKR
jgi:hypothetical protein